MPLNPPSPVRGAQGFFDLPQGWLTTASAEPQDVEDWSDEKLRRGGHYMPSRTIPLSDE